MLTQSYWVTAGKVIKTERSQGNKGIAGLPPEVVGSRGRYLTGLVEPCGALPRKCLFIYLSQAVKRLNFSWGKRLKENQKVGLCSPLPSRFHGAPPQKFNFLQDRL
jgi:hypothetical protein